MSSALAIASVTALLKSLLENGLTERSVSDSIGHSAPVSVLPPDRITTGSDEQPQLNLFLYQIAPNTVRRRQDHPDATRGDQASGSFLALDLFYLITAYGATDYQIEILLGSALQLLQREHELKPERISSILASLSSARDDRGVLPAAAALARSNLPRQVKEIKFTPQFLQLEELSKIWSALQARYRPSAVYKASLVYID